MIDGEHIELRIGVCGNVDSGKSSTVGVLTQGQLDNGRGLARMCVLKHKHEKETGRTSSIGQQIMGFNDDGKVVSGSSIRSSSCSGDGVSRRRSVPVGTVG